MLDGFHTEATPHKLEELELTLDERKFAKFIRGDTIWNNVIREEQKAKTSRSSVRIIFELKDEVFTYKGIEDISTPEEECFVYTNSATNEGSLIKIIHNLDLRREEIMDYFTSTFNDEIFQGNYYKQLNIEIRNIITGEWPDFFNPKTYQLYTKPKDATFKEAMSLYNQNKYIDSLPLFLESYEGGNGNAAFMLGQLYGSGNLSEQADYKNGDRKKAAEYMKEGALRHNAQSQFAYGIFHFDTNFPQNVIKKDFNKAFAWIYLSATQNFLPAVKFTYQYHQHFLPVSSLQFMMQE